MTFYRSKGPEVSILCIGEYSEEWILVLVSAWQKVQSNIPRHNLALTDTEWRDEYREPLLCRCLQAASVFPPWCVSPFHPNVPDDIFTRIPWKPPETKERQHSPEPKCAFLVASGEVMWSLPSFWLQVVHHQRVTLETQLDQLRPVASTSAGS